jgi:hypothetical protein
MSESTHIFGNGSFIVIWKAYIGLFLLDTLCEDNSRHDEGTLNADWDLNGIISVFAMLNAHTRRGNLIGEWFRKNTCWE